MTAADIKQSALFGELRASVIHSRKKKAQRISMIFCFVLLLNCFVKVEYYFSVDYEYIHIVS